MNLVGERIVSLRKEMGLRLSELSRKIEIPRSTLWGYENGGVVASDQLSKLAAFFDVSVDYLIGATEFQKGIRYLEEVFIDDESNRIKNSEFFDKASKLTPENRVVVNNMVDALLNK